MSDQAASPAPEALKAERFDGDAVEWDAFVRSAPGTSHHHLYGWRRIMERVLGHECLYLATRNQTGALTAALPLTRVKSPLFGHFLVSMPFVNYGGPIGSAQGVQVLAAEARRLADAQQVKLLELRSRHQVPVDLPVSHRKLTVVLDIPVEGSDALFKKLDSKLRSQVRRPSKEGVTYRFGQSEVNAFFSVFSRHMRDLGTPTLSRELFEQIAVEFPESCWFGAAYLNDEPIACGCGFRWGDEFEMTWASSLREFNRVSANMGLYWAFMERAAGDGARAFNFGRCTPGSRTHGFKRQWGGRDEILWWYQHARGDMANASTPSPDSGAFSWGPHIWRKLPLSVANLLGPRIVRFIP